MLKIKAEISAQIPVENINMLTRIIEACGHVGIVSTLDRKAGIVIIRGTEDTLPDLGEILAHLPFPISILKKL